MNNPINDEGNIPEAQHRAPGDGAGGNGEAQMRTRDAVRNAGVAGKERLRAGTGRAAAEVDDVAEAVGTAASELSQLEHENLADYANRLSSSLSDLSGKLRDKSVDELAGDVRRLAARNPALFLLGSVAVGLGLSRFAKASRETPQSHDGRGDDAEWHEAVGNSAEPAYAARETIAAEAPLSPNRTGGSGL